jgi:hypothetical protein
MWRNISQRLDAELAAADQRPNLVRRFQSASGLALVAAAGIFGLMLLPVGQRADQLTTQGQPAPYVNPVDERDLSARAYMKYRRELIRQQADQPPIHETAPVATGFANISVPN